MQIFSLILYPIPHDSLQGENELHSDNTETNIKLASNIDDIKIQIEPF